MFDLTGRRYGIQHRPTKPNHPRTNGPVGRFHFDEHEQLRQHLATFLAACVVAYRPKSLRGLSPHRLACSK